MTGCKPEGPLQARQVRVSCFLFQIATVLMRVCGWFALDALFKGRRKGLGYLRTGNYTVIVCQWKV